MLQRGVNQKALLNKAATLANKKHLLLADPTQPTASDKAVKPNERVKPAYNPIARIS